MVLLIIGLLLLTAAVRLVHRPLHAVGNPVGIHNNAAMRITRSTANRLNHRRIAAQKALLIGIENRNQRHLRQIQALTQKVNADEHVELAAAQTVDNLRTLNRRNLRMQIAHTHACLLQIFRQILGHALRQRRHQNTLASRSHLVNLA